MELDARRRVGRLGKWPQAQAQPLGAEVGHGSRAIGGGYTEGWHFGSQAGLSFVRPLSSAPLALCLRGGGA